MHAIDNSNPHPVLKFNAQGKITQVNQAARDIFGLKLGKSLYNLIPAIKSRHVKLWLKEAKRLELCAVIKGLAFECFVVTIPEEQCGLIYARDISEFKDFSQEWRQVLQSYQQQLKELSCIYGLAESIRSRRALDEICRDLVKLMPQAWQYPEQARAKIILEDKEFVSEPFEAANWGQSAAILVGDASRGMVQVFYVDAPPGSTEEPAFLPAERNLLDALARTLGEAVERREAEAANAAQTLMLAQERNRFETILRSIGDGVLVTDASDQVVLMNNAAQHLLGLSEQESAGADFLAMIDDEAFKKAWIEAASSGLPLARRDLHIKSEPARTLMVNRSTMDEQTSGERWFVTVLHDVTKEREIEQMKSDFVSAVSHELRTPLTSIKGFTSTLLRKDDLPQELRTRFLNIINEESDRLIKLIEELLLISRIESGRVLLERAAVDINHLVNTVTAILLPGLNAKRHRFERDTPKDLPKPVGDSRKIQMVLGNLLDNAIKFTPEHGRVALRAYAEDDCIVIQVQDSGPGIPRAELPRIFDRFYRVHRDGQQESGTGLGLFIVREMVNLHGGRIDVDSEPGQGATFTVRLPMVAAEQEPAADEAVNS